MKTKNIFLILGTANAILGAILYFGAEEISIAAGVSDSGLLEATYGRMALGGSIAGQGLLTLFLRNLTGQGAKNALLGYVAAGVLQMVVILSRICTDENYAAPFALIVPVFFLIALAFYGSRKA